MLIKNILLLVLFVFILVIAVSFLIPNFSPPIQKLLPTNQSSSTLLPTPPVTTWKTYTNETYGFSFDYPPEWKLNIELEKPNENSTSLYFGIRTKDPNMFAGFVLIIAPNPKQLSLEESIRERYDQERILTLADCQYRFGNAQECLEIVGGWSAYREQYGNIDIAYFLEGPTYVVEISWNPESTFDVRPPGIQLLSTFQFLK